MENTARNTSTEKMKTVTNVINHLRQAGYTTDFNLLANGLSSSIIPEHIRAEDFEIDKSFRFEGDSNPSDESVVYAISVPKLGLKGVIVNGYGAYSDPLAGEMTEKFNKSPRAELSFAAFSRPSDIAN